MGGNILLLKKNVDNSMFYKDIGPKFAISSFKWPSHNTGLLG